MSEARFQSYLRLVRFPLVFTMWSDVLAGYFIVTIDTGGTLNSGAVASMLAVTGFLYAGGMTLSDCFRYASAKEHGHPQTLPVGLLSAHAAFAVAFIMILLAIVGATLVSRSAGLMSALVALLLLVFASLTRQMSILGPANLAFCRGVNVILGAGFAHHAGPLLPKVEHWAPAVAVFGFAFLVTQISSEETHPRRERLVRLIGALIVLLVLLNVFLYTSSLSKAQLTLKVIMSIFVAGVILRLLQLARRTVHELSTESVQKLVVAGLVGTIVLNANFVAFTGEIGPTVGILFLLLPSFILFRFFHMLYPGTETAMD